MCKHVLRGLPVAGAEDPGGGRGWGGSEETLAEASPAQLSGMEEGTREDS